MATGIKEELFLKWMEKGRQKPQSKWGKFRFAVLEAQAQARVKAEQALFDADPVAWLKAGPGKERPGSPG